MNNNNEIVKELNDFLKGINMGLDTFEDFGKKVKSPNLKSEFTSIISKFSKQKDTVVSLIEKSNGEPKDSLGIAGEIASMFEKLKELFMNTDEEILENALKGMDMGIEQSEKVINSLENIPADEAIIKPLKSIVEEYRMIYSHLKNLSQNPSL